MGLHISHEQAREWFRIAHRGFMVALKQVSGDQLEDPALGDWDVRSLLGHLSRQYQTIESGLGAISTGEVLPSAAAYYAVIAAQHGDPEAATDRGRIAGQLLGEDPIERVELLARRVMAMLKQTPDTAIVVTPFGSMRLPDYLQTRAFELSVHTLDLCRALDLPLDEDQTNACSYACHFAVQLAAQRGASAQLLLALTGRGSLPDAFGAL